MDNGKWELLHILMGMQRKREYEEYAKQTQELDETSFESIDYRCIAYLSLYFRGISCFLFNHGVV